MEDETASVTAPLACLCERKDMAADELSEAHERERQQYRQEIDSLTKAVDSMRSGSLSKLKDERERCFIASIPTDLSHAQGSNPICVD